MADYSKQIASLDKYISNLQAAEKKGGVTPEGRAKLNEYVARKAEYVARQTPIDAGIYRQIKPEDMPKMVKHIAGSPSGSSDGSVPRSRSSYGLPPDFSQLSSYETIISRPFRSQGDKRIDVRAAMATRKATAKAATKQITKKHYGG